ncbi:acyl carrier protein [Streptomyces alkaliphilus]|uniref:acyl carrier protein n=1 Tax=Streptomyces alkaliphilus TaxID=1472722 RepID=UPI002B214BA6|nr:acyl carrier protein [Streptomyces alkaliphilus]
MSTQPEENDIKRFIITSFIPDTPVGDLPADLDLLENGVVDSLGLLRLISWVGSAYDIPVAERDITPHQFSSVTAIAEFVRQARVH